jgi:uncharacterized protein (TIGR01777 family)
MTFDETSGSGTGFLADLCVEWEQEARQAERIGMRVVCLRFGMVLEQDGGALARMLLPFRLGLGGPMAPGTQWVSWIHRQDLIQLLLWVIAHREIHGPVNGVAPEVVTMQELCRTLGQALRKPSWLQAPAFVLHLGLGELATMLTTGQHVKPVASLLAGFSFRYPAMSAALAAIVRPQSSNHFATTPC